MIGTLEMPEVRQPVSKRFLYRAAKRISDIVISVLGLAVLSAVFVITALAIALEDGGPVFYAQNSFLRKFFFPHIPPPKRRHA